MQCDILDWILEQKKDISGKNGRIQIKFVAQLTVMFQYDFFFFFDESAAVM